VSDPESGGYVYTYDALNRLSNIQDFQQLNYGGKGLPMYLWEMASGYWKSLSGRRSTTRP
jgi:hypothetical protein